MQRRTLLKIGTASGLMLAAGAAVVVSLDPHRQAGRLTPAGRALWSAVARGVLGPLVPTAEADAAAALDAHLQRLQAALLGMPASVQAEVDELGTLLISSAGRRWLAGLATPWAQASAGDVEAALRALRQSPLALRQQVYQALRELTNAAYFADAAVWRAFGYSGQTPVPGPSAA
jgi:hypothetical protein